MSDEISQKTSALRLDKALYRQAYAALRQQNQAELRERALHRNQTSPATNWRQFVALVEFCWRISPAQSDYQRRDKLTTWAQYFERVKRLDAWRRSG